MSGSINNVLSVRAVATGTTETFVMTRAARAMDFVLIATNGGAGTVTLRNGANAITAALNPASTDTAALRPAKGGVFTAASKILAVGDVLTFLVSANTLNYEGYAYLYPTPAVSL